MLGALENGLFALGQVLRFPVMALLWVCVAATVYMAGQCLIDAAMRLRERASFNIDRWVALGGTIESKQNQLPSELRRFVLSVEELSSIDDGGLEHLALESEERIRRSLTGPRMLVRVGPSLGLIGTLIPMGTSLASLASGNIEVMAGQMVVAFTTTIIGLSTGTLAYVIAAIRLAWVNQAVREQRYIAEKILAEKTKEGKSKEEQRVSVPASPLA